jgi:hypothetical protein
MTSSVRYSTSGCGKYGKVALTDHTCTGGQRRRYLISMHS